jgi:hypothetical protein
MMEVFASDSILLLLALMVTPFSVAFAAGPDGRLGHRIASARQPVPRGCGGRWVRLNHLAGAQRQERRGGPRLPHMRSLMRSLLPSSNFVLQPISHRLGFPFDPGPYVAAKIAPL